ncbi:MAG TPA: cupin domain-containing protein [Lacibacter sp.]|nr:cupin domain-containing protein [Lacibacter sp.]HMO89355.1 cupin domain-containing protein [Lacibacter sp.]HMP87537.1 cupin domain-containing protein [Lacibacter sp.]
MQRKDFITNALLAVPALVLSETAKAGTSTAREPFVVDAGKSRFGEDNKFMGVHPNDLKISGKDTDGQLSVFEYTGYAKVGPSLHIHLKQDEIFTVIEGEYRFVVGNKTHVLKPGQTIFLPRGIPHTWIQLTDKGRLIYFLQPAGKMEEFFSYMGKVKQRLSDEEMARIHDAHDMKVVGPPLTL